MRITKFATQSPELPLMLAGLALVLSVSVPVQAGQLVISSLPYTVSQSQHSTSTWDTVTINGRTLSSATSGITFGSGTHHWLLLLRTGSLPDTVIFGTDGTTPNTRGVATSTSSYDIIIRGGYILHRPAGIPDNFNGPYNVAHEACQGARAINLQGQYITVDSVLRAEVRGYAEQTHVIAGGGKMMTINASRLFNECYAFNRRDLYEATCVKSEGLDQNDLSAGEYHYRITNSYLSDKAHANTYFANDKVDGHYGVVQIERDTFYLDLRNRKYTSYPAGLYNSTTNGYSVTWTRMGPGSTIKNCVFTAGNQYEGGRGILLTHAVGTQSTPVEVAYNKISSHNGPNTEYGSDYNCVAVKFRQHNTGVWFHHNSLTVTADTTTTLGATSYLPAGVALWLEPSYTWDGSNFPPYYLTIENNACSAKVITNVNRSSYNVAAVNFETLQILDPTIIWRNNTIYSEGNYAYDFGQFDGTGNHLRLVGDTVTLISNNLPRKLTFNLGDNRGCFDNWATDFFFKSPTTFSIGHYDQGNATYSGTQDIKIRRTLSVYVKGNDGDPVVNASVSVRNAYNQTVLSGVTNNGGRLTGIVSCWFESRTDTDSTAYNNFTASAQSGSDNTSRSFAVTWNAYKDTLTLSQTAGTGTWESGDPEPPQDTIPPNKIDLGIVPTGPKTSVTLTWIAPGDDGSVGTATSYDLRRSTAQITSSNFAGATAITGEPAPKPAGSTETFTVNGLDSTLTYYFAIKAADEVPNWSIMSNVVVRQPGGDETSPARINNMVASTGSAEGEIDLNWTATGDDSITGTADHYLVRYSTQAINGTNWGSATPVAAPPAPLAANTPQSMTLGGLTPGVIYYAGIVAVDEAGNQSALSNIASAQAKIIIVTGEDSINVSIVEPTDYAVIPDVQPSLVVLNYDTASTNIYRFEVATDSSFVNIVASSGEVYQQDGLQTSWQVSPPLPPQGDYYWHVKLNNSEFGRFAAFTVDVAAKAYPNPFRLAEGNQMTFAGIPSGSNLLLMTTSGETIRRWVNTDGADIHWNGKNENGQEVASGVYLWYVESSDMKGKLIVIR